MTNADKIRAMTDEEMAECLHQACVDAVLYTAGMSKATCPLAFDSVADANDWLQQEAEYD